VWPIYGANYGSLLLDRRAHVWINQWQEDGTKKYRRGEMRYHLTPGRPFIELQLHLHLRHLLWSVHQVI
jgi:hypothetical protein